MEKFKEKKIVNRLNIITIILMSCWFISLFIGIFFNINIIMLCFLLMLLALIFNLIALYLSNINKYTDEFIEYINNKINNAKSLDELYVIEKEFIYLAIENKSYCLSYPMTLKNIHRNINSKIEILEKLS